MTSHNHRQLDCLHFYPEIWSNHYRSSNKAVGQDHASRVCDKINSIPVFNTIDKPTPKNFSFTMTNNMNTGHVCSPKYLQVDMKQIMHWKIKRTYSSIAKCFDIFNQPRHTMTSRLQKTLCSVFIHLGIIYRLEIYITFHSFAACYRWIPRTKANEAELWCFLWSAPALNKLLRKQSWSWWFEAPSRSLWRHCNDSLILCRQALLHSLMTTLTSQPS